MSRSGRCLFPALLLTLLMLAGGCTIKRPVTITTTPADAQIRINGIDRGKGPITEEFVFENKEQTHVVTASRLGFREQPVPIKSDYKGNKLHIELKPFTARITINVAPVPAKVFIDGRQVGPETDTITRDLEFTVDPQTNKWTTHRIAAERKGFQRIERLITWQDKEPVYNLRLEPQTKPLNVTTTPPGAQVLINGEPLGNSPVSVPAREFPIDLTTDEAVPQKLRAVKPGYDPIEMMIGWDDGKSDYHIDLAAKTKTIRFITNPSGAVVTFDGKPIEKDKTGAPSTTLQFPPINEKGDLKTYQAVIVKKTGDSEWEPAKMTIGWDSGRQDYSVALKEILTRPVQLLSGNLQRTDDGWEMTPQITTTLAMKDVTEGAKKEPPLQITKLPRGTQIDTIAASPDGTRLLFTVIYGNTPATFRSQMIAVHTDGSGGADYLSDGKSLEITPSYTPDGEQVVFSSNRAGKRLSIWAMSAGGAPGITQLTSGNTNDLWPTIDSDPKKRLFYQAMVDTRPDPRIYMTQLGTVTLTDMTQMSGSQPRVSPRADAVVFTAVNDKTGKRDIYMMPDRGGVPRNLTNTPDIDEYDPAWNKDATRLAFVSDAGVDEDRRPNLDIWVMDISRPERPAQVTTNGSHDDHPAWDPTGNNIYFRSNRGGEWAIWKITAK
jgi:Tol biopolymer transport system component